MGHNGLTKPNIQISYKNNIINVLYYNLYLQKIHFGLTTDRFCLCKQGEIGEYL